MPNISVIVPIYNVEKYLDRCIDSVLNQTLKSLELILVNDGSTDKSGHICDIKSKYDDRIKVLHKKNGGVSSARNLGIDIAKGEYLYFLDPDDYLDLDALEYLYELAILNKADITCYKMNIYVNGILKSQIERFEKIELYYNEEILNEYMRNYKFLNSCWNKLYLKNLFFNKENRFNEKIRYAEDALFNCYILSKSKKLVFSNLQKYNYCINSKSIVNKVTEKRLDILKAQKQMYYFLLNNNYKYEEKVLNEYVNSSILIPIDIAIQGNIYENRKILKKLKNLIRDDKDILKDISKVKLKNRICFYILKLSPITISIIYKLRLKFKKL